MERIIFREGKMTDMGMGSEILTRKSPAEL